jgi:excisionase family DNA binding protein
MNAAERVAQSEFQPELYRIREAAAILAISPRMVYSLIACGSLRPVRLPGSGTKRQAVRIARADVLALIERLRGVRG